MISVTIYEADLTSRNACDDGLKSGMALFRSVACIHNGLGYCAHVRDWTTLHSVWLLSSYPGFYSWLRGYGLIPDANLAGAYLADANLAGAYLAGAYLADANLAGANLADANLARANLAGANLAGANLARAYLADAYLARAYLADAYRPTNPPAGYEPDAYGFLRKITQ